MTHSKEITDGQRFEFGDNWARFLSVLDDERILEAEKSLKTMLRCENLRGKAFLDVGSGSGLFSLAARRLGAKVHSIDYDPKSVACTKELRRRYSADDENWMIEEGSVLNITYLTSLGKFDIVYSWGVLHHTGAMWQALENVQIPLKEGGFLFISIYNDQGSWSRRWKIIKKIYNVLPRALKLPYAISVTISREMRYAIWPILSFRPHKYIRSLMRYKKNRGMSLWHDAIDWVGGYPFEVAKPEEIFNFYRSKGYVLEKLRTLDGGSGCNEYVFTKHGGKSDKL